MKVISLKSPGGLDNLEVLEKMPPASRARVKYGFASTPVP